MMYCFLCKLKKYIWKMFMPLEVTLRFLKIFLHYIPQLFSSWLVFDLFLLGRDVSFDFWSVFIKKKKAYYINVEKTNLYTHSRCCTSDWERVSHPTLSPNGIYSLLIHPNCHTAVCNKKKNIHQWSK